MTKELHIKDIDTSAATQVRALNPDVVAEYQELYESNTQLPPIEVFDDGNGVLRCADGFHRCKAAEAAGKATILANMHEGGRIEALKLALGANTTHGYRRTAADKRVAVMKALQEFGDVSDRRIADICKVSPTLVGTVRKEVEPPPVHMDSQDAALEEKRIGKDGVARRMPRVATNEDSLIPFTPGEVLPSPTDVPPPEVDGEPNPPQAYAGDPEALLKTLSRRCAQVMSTARSIMAEHPRLKSRVRTCLNELRNEIEAFHKNSLPKKHNEELKNAA
jgi:uncharacterized ParB-like nuclease family protein